MIDGELPAEGDGTHCSIGIDPQSIGMHKKRNGWHTWTLDESPRAQSTQSGFKVRVFRMKVFQYDSASHMDCTKLLIGWSGIKERVFEAIGEGSAVPAAHCPLFGGGIGEILSPDGPKGSDWTESDGGNTIIIWGND